MNDFWITIIVIIGTIGAYLIAKWGYQRFYTPLLLPVFIATLLIVICLIVFNISYDTYMIGGKWIHHFLGPAVVALAYPLYQHRAILQKLTLPIVIGTLVGAITGIVSGVLMTKALGFEEQIVYSILPKSVTTPVAMDISESLNGIASLSVVFVMIAGIAGAMGCKLIFRLFRMQDPVGRGIGLGAASHAIGTAKALEDSALEGSISTVSMILSAIFVSVITPYLVMVLM